MVDFCIFMYTEIHQPNKTMSDYEVDENGVRKMKDENGNVAFVGLDGVIAARPPGRMVAQRTPKPV